MLHKNPSKLLSQLRFCKLSSFNTLKFFTNVSPQTLQTPTSKAQVKTGNNEDAGQFLSDLLGIEQSKFQKLKGFDEFSQMTVDRLRKKIILLCNTLDIQGARSQARLKQVLFTTPELLTYGTTGLALQLGFWIHRLGTPAAVVEAQSRILLMDQQFVLNQLQTIKKLGIMSTAIYSVPFILELSGDTLHQRIEDVGELLQIPHETTLSLIRRRPDVLYQSHKLLQQLSNWLVGKGWEQGQCGDILLECPLLFQTPIKVLEKRFNSLLGMNVTVEDARRVIGAFPALLMHELDSQEQQSKIRFMSDQLEMDVSSVLTKLPKSVEYSLQKRVGPRIMYLKEQNMHNKIHDWMEVMNLTDKEFCANIVQRPHADYANFRQHEWDVKMWPFLSKQTEILQKDKSLP